MKRKLLGKTGVEIPEIGLGTWEYKGGVEPLRTGISHGAFMIDTAEAYRTEDVVGKSIEGIKRDEVFIATKVWPNHIQYDDLIKSAEASLRRLGISTIDLYQIHWPSPSIPIRETMKAMEELVKCGRIRYIGLSNFSVNQTKEAQEALSTQEIVSNQVEYNLSNRRIEKELLPYCRSQKITVIAYSPLVRGASLSSEQDKGNILRQIESKYGKTRAQVILNWITSRENVVAIPKADKVEHVKENCGASGWRLEREDIEKIDAMSAR